jgi:hypothetical protein
VIVVLHFVPSEDQDVFADRARAALAALADRPGYRGGTVGRAADDETAWVMVTEWESVGAYRRALGAFDVKMVATPLMAQAVDQPSAFEPLVHISGEGVETRRKTDRAADADWTSRSELP